MYSDTALSKICGEGSEHALGHSNVQQHIIMQTIKKASYIKLHSTQNQNVILLQKPNI